MQELIIKKINMNRVYKYYLSMHNSRCNIYRRFMEIFLRIVFSCDIPPQVQIGDNCRFAHNALGVVIHPEAIIGNNCKIGQNVTIGGRSALSILPVIEDNVEIGANALILGPIRIGKGSIIGAGSVVIKDVPPYSVVVGNPGKIIKTLN